MALSNAEHQRRWRKRHPGRAAARQAEWVKAHPEKVRAGQARYLARKAAGETHVLTARDSEGGGVCSKCGPVTPVRWARGWMCGVRATELGWVGKGAPQERCPRCGEWMLVGGKCPLCTETMRVPPRFDPAQVAGFHVEDRDDPEFAWTDEDLVASFADVEDLDVVGSPDEPAVKPIDWSKCDEELRALGFSV